MNAAQTGKDTEPALDSTSRRPEIIANFSGYKPPFDPVSIVERMLASVPSKYLIGLQRIVLTDSTGLPRKLRRAVTKSRGRKVKIAETRGLYHPEWHGTQAWIEIFVDNVLRRCEEHWWSKLGFLREAEIADVLFHEIGHHIHFATRPEYREKEDVADLWKVRLNNNYLRGTHRLLRAIFSPLRPLIEICRRALGKQMLVQGAISRAEFDEDFKRK